MSTSAYLTTTASPTLLHLLVGPRISVQLLATQFLALRPADESWAVLSNEPGLLSGEQLAGVHWRELFGGCACCTAANSPILRTTMSQLLRCTPKPRRLLILLPPDATPSRLLPTLAQYFGKTAPLHSILLATNVATHVAVLTASGAEGGRIVGGTPYIEQLELADVVVGLSNFDAVPNFDYMTWSLPRKCAVVLALESLDSVDSVDASSKDSVPPFSVAQSHLATVAWAPPHSSSTSSSTSTSISSITSSRSSSNTTTTTSGSSSTSVNTSSSGTTSTSTSTSIRTTTSSDGTSSGHGLANVEGCHRHAFVSWPAPTPPSERGGSAEEGLPVAAFRCLSLGGESPGGAGAFAGGPTLAATWAIPEGCKFAPASMCASAEAAARAAAAAAVLAVFAPDRRSGWLCEGMGSNSAASCEVEVEMVAVLRSQLGGYRRVACRHSRRVVGPRCGRRSSSDGDDDDDGATVATGAPAQLLAATPLPPPLPGVATIDVSAGGDGDSAAAPGDDVSRCCSRPCASRGPSRVEVTARFVLEAERYQGGQRGGVTEEALEAWVKGLRSAEEGLSIALSPN